MPIKNKLKTVLTEKGVPTHNWWYRSYHSRQSTHRDTRALFSNTTKNLTRILDQGPGTLWQTYFHTKIIYTAQIINLSEISECSEQQSNTK